MARGAAPARKDTRQLQGPEKPPRAKGTATPLHGDGSRVASLGSGSVKRGPWGSERVCAKAGTCRRFPLRAGAPRKSSLHAAEGLHCERRRRHTFDGAKLCAAQDPATVEGGCSGHDSIGPRPPVAPPGGEAGASSACSPGAPAASRTRGTRAGLAAVGRGRRVGGRAGPRPGAHRCLAAAPPRPIRSTPTPTLSAKPMDA